MPAALNAAPEGSIVLIQPVCHNPTGVDPTRDDEEAVTGAMLAKGHIAVFDMAHQGHAEGIEEDAGFVGRYAARASGCFIANSFSKIFSLRGERVGGLNVVCADADEAELVQGQLKLAVRRSHSSPPATGALLVAGVLNDPELNALVAKRGRGHARTNDRPRGPCWPRRSPSVPTPSTPPSSSVNAACSAIPACRRRRSESRANAWASIWSNRDAHVSRD